MRYNLLFIFSFLTLIGRAEVEYSPPLVAYLDAQLVVSGNVVLEKNNAIITIDKVFRNQTGRQYIPSGKVAFGRDRYGPFSYIHEGSPKSKYLLYLKEYNGKMYLYAGSQHIYELDKTGVFPICSADSVFQLNYEEAKHALSEFQKCFSLRGNSAQVKIKAEEYKTKINRSNAVQYALENPFKLLNPYIEEFIELIEPEPYISDDTTIYQIVEEMPQYPGGNKALYAYVSKELNYPDLAKENGISGTVYVQMVIERDGTISQIEVMRGVEKLLDQEAVRVVSLLPNFIPGKQRNKPVRCMYRLPIRFRLE